MLYAEFHLQWKVQDKLCTKTPDMMLKFILLSFGLFIYFYLHELQNFYKMPVWPNFNCFLWNTSEPKSGSGNQSLKDTPLLQEKKMESINFLS